MSMKQAKRTFLSKILTWKHSRRKGNVILRSAAIKLGYFTDPFVKCIVKEEQKRDIIINRGYWSRVAGIQEVQKRFLALKGDDTDNLKRQIISFGCGYDTFVFNQFSKKDKLANFSYFELDLQEVTTKKVKFIRDSH